MTGKLPLLACVAVAALSAHEASAQGAFDGRLYGTLFGGANWLEGGTLTIDPGPNNFIPSDAFGTIDFDLGYAFGAALGVALHHNLRGEFELSYRRNGVSSFFEGTVTTDLTQGGDHVDAFALMANLWYDHSLHDGWDIHFGGGIGAARIGYDLANMSDDDPNAPLDDAAWTFAGQVGVGVGKKLNNGQTLSLDYRLFLAGSVDLVGSDSNGSPVPTSTPDYVAHSLLLTWRVPLNGQ